MPEINLSQINPWALPRVALSNLRKLPAAPGVYFALFGDQLLYVGITSLSLRRRWIRHHRYGDLSSVKGVEIAYLVVSRSFEELQEIERGLIDLLNPVLNNGPVYNRFAMRPKASPSVEQSFAAWMSAYDNALDEDEDIALWVESQQEMEYFALGLYD